MSMRMAGRAAALAVIAAALAACGGGEAGTAKAAGPGAGKAGAVGGETIGPSTAPIPGATRPVRAEDLELRAQAPSPVGPVSEARAAAYPVRVEVHNVSGDRVSIERMWLHTSVYDEGYLVGDCGDGEALPVTSARTALSPGQSFVITHGLPCAIAEPGRYDVASVVMVGMAPEAVGLDPALSFAVSASTPLVIDARLPEYEPGTEQVGGAAQRME